MAESNVKGKGKEEIKKSKYAELEEQLGYRKKNIWTTASEKELGDIMLLGEDYKYFIGQCKTERETIAFYEKKAKAAGFRDLSTMKGKGKPGDKFYLNHRNKNIFLVVLGTAPFTEGLNLIGGHADAPRLDLKQHPLNEDTEIAFLKTHYYGGIKKYQWLNVHLALHGVVMLESGKKIDFVIGEKEDDPVFVIADLLPHLSRKLQGSKTLLEAVEGENLVIMVGNTPVAEKTVKDKVKLWVLEYLNKRYGMREEDFVSAEIEAVPANRPRDIGFDRSMIGAYGHDDRVCSYLAAEALLKVSKPKRTAVAMIVDKEEVGSAGSTGSDSYMLHHLYTLIGELTGDSSNPAIMRSFMNSYCISSDVADAVNPPYKSVHDLQNAANLANGIGITKYTGVGGKGGANDADAEYLGKVRALLNKHKIPWQYSMLGKVDEGGGGTIAKFVAWYGIHTIDAGIPVSAMHSPCEIISKADLWAGMRMYEAFFAEFGG